MRTSSGPFTLGSITASTGPGQVEQRLHVGHPVQGAQTVDADDPLDPGGPSRVGRVANAVSRAAALSFGATASSRSTQTMSVPLLSAFGNMSGRVPGAKMNVRRGRGRRSAVVTVTV